MSNSLRKRDIENIWHPYTDISTFENTDFPVIERSGGCFIYDTAGRELLDGISSWWCVNLGHGHPRLVRAVQEQAEKLQQVILGGMSHVNAVRLAEKLVQITPARLKHVFFASDGSSAVEASLRMALQYWVNIGEKGRNYFISLEDGYHGDSLGAVSVGYVETFHKELKDVLHTNYRASSPHCAQCPYEKHPDSCDVECFEPMEKLIRKRHRETAAVIVEPLCQGAAGIRLYREEYLMRLRTLCDEYDLLLIADEIAVGFGRTGFLFACERAGIEPDIMTLGKGLTGGYLPMSAAVASDKIYDSFRNGKTFYHGHTYCGNPIVSAVALEALAVYEEDTIIGNLAPRIRQLEDGMKEAASLFSSSYVYAKGMIGMIEVSDKDGGAEKAREIADKAMDLGLFIRPLGASVYLWPPLVVTENELAQMLYIVRESIRNVL